MSLTANLRTAPNRRVWWMIGAWAVCLIVASGGLYARYRIAEARVAEKTAAERALVMERAERAKAEADALAERESAIGDMRETAMHGYAAVDHEGRIIEWNPALTRWLGYSREEIIGRKITEIMEPADAALHAPAFKAHMADKSKWQLVVTVACQVIHKDGPAHPPVPIRVTARVLPTKENPSVPYAIALVDLQSRIISAEAKP